jgi:hypothetical protein
VFLFFYPEDYRTLFALSIIPGIVVILVLLRVPDTNTKKAEPEAVEPLEPSEPF